MVAKRHKNACVHDFEIVLYYFSWFWAKFIEAFSMVISRGASIFLPLKISLEMPH
jgi:hypothetical protein